LDWEVLPHPPYSPDISASDYHLFRALDNSMRNKTFLNDGDLKCALATFFTSQSKEFWQFGIDSLMERWQKVVEIEGDYFDE
jgi:[histone H3]-lysine36 N-dimethyltransferase SETMAR